MDPDHQKRHELAKTIGFDHYAKVPKTSVTESPRNSNVKVSVTFSCTLQTRQTPLPAITA